MTSLASRVTAISAISLLAVGCATKRYPIATDIAPAEVQLMTCDNIALELVRADQLEKKINETEGFDSRTVLGFLGDFGVGNSMAKSEARSALASRRASLHDAQLQKGCMKDKSAAIALSSEPMLGAAPAKN